MSQSSIEWTEATWNPTTGCDKISAGCKFCYAINMSNRLQSIGHSAEKYAGVVEKTKSGLNWTGKINLHEPSLTIPVFNKKPTIYFVNSMSDLFHKDVPLDYIKRVFAVMNNTPQHTYQVLTKRADRLNLLHSQLNWTDNIWMGVSVEDDRQLSRVDFLRHTGAKVKFLSCEPLIGSLKNIDLTNIDWVIAGGESGSKARPMHPDWARELKDKCIEADVAFFFKQWGEWWPGTKQMFYPENKPLYYLEEDGSISWFAGDADTTINYSENYTGQGQAIEKCGKSKSGRLLDGQEWNQMPTVKPVLQ